MSSYTALNCTSRGLTRKISSIRHLKISYQNQGLRTWPFNLSYKLEVRDRKNIEKMFIMFGRAELFVSTQTARNCPSLVVWWTFSISITDQVTVTISHCRSPAITVDQHQSPSVIISHRQSVSVIVNQCQSLSVNLNHCKSRSVTLGNC